MSQNLTRTRALIAAHGGDPARWPGGAGAPDAALADHPDLAHDMAAARTLDRALRGWPATVPSAGLAERIVAAAVGLRQAAPSMSEERAELALDRALRAWTVPEAARPELAARILVAAARVPQERDLADRRDGRLGHWSRLVALRAEAAAFLATAALLLGVLVGALQSPDAYPGDFVGARDLVLFDLPLTEDPQ